MNINNVNKINKIQNVMKAYDKNKSENIQKISLKEDKIEISQMGKDYQLAMEAFKNLPEIREEKVNAIKEQINSGTYKIDKQELAKAMVKGLL